MFNDVHLALRLASRSAVAVVMLVPTSQAALTITHQDSLRANAKTPEIAIKSTGPVFFVQDTFEPYRSSYSEDGSSWTGIGSGASGGDWSGHKALDVQVDISDNVHLAWGRHNVSNAIWWQAQTDGVNWGDEENVGDQPWYSVPGGRVQLQVNDDGVHVGWIPRNLLGGGDSWQAVYHYRNRDPCSGSWSTILEMQNGTQSQNSPQLLASATEVYYFSLERNNQPNGGPYVQQVGTGTVTNLWSGLTTGLMPIGSPAAGLSPAWNSAGTQMNLSSIEMTGSYGDQSGLVALYLDVLGTPSEVVVYDDSASHGGIGTANATSLAVVGDLNYVFFSAEDPGAGTDRELFVQIVDANGTLVGAVQQLTTDDDDQQDLEVVYADEVFHLVYETGDPEASVNVDYMTLVDYPPPADCEEALFQGYGNIADISGPDSAPDCYVNLLDFAALVRGWLICTDPTNPDCEQYYWYWRPSFVDMTSELGLSGMSSSPAAWGDFNNNTYPDLYDGDNLWRNESGTGFTPLTGYAWGIWGDYNNDDYLDLFILEGTSVVMRNLSGSGFAPVSLPALPTTYNRGASWTDLDNDGWLDLYVGGYELGGYQPDAVLTNNQGASFTKTWQEPPVPPDYVVFPGRGVAACDFDQDGDQDIYVSNYRVEANYLWRNNGSGVLTDVAGTYGVAGTYNGWRWSYGHTIGSAWGDFDNDGYIDLFVGNFSHSDAWQDRARFYRNLGPGGSWHFQQMWEMTGGAWQEAYATPAVGDYDNDGDLDLFLTTAPGQEYAGDHPRLYRNDGDWTFTDVTIGEGLGSVPQSYQAAWADIDKDGDLDLASGGRLYVNNGNDNHWLEVQLRGNGVNVNRTAIGAQARIDLGGGIVLTRQVEGGTGEGNQNDIILHFGLGARTAPISLQLRWPNGTTQTVEDISVDQRISVQFSGP